jgi:hypothetical protein
MKHRTMLFAATLLALPVAQAAEMDHSKMDHAAMGHGAPAASEGPWSYKGRNNPVPHKSGRWEMVPVPGYGHMFISTQGLSQELRCAALANPGVMVDRVTRKACGLPERAMMPAAGARPAADAPSGHGGH